MDFEQVGGLVKQVAEEELVPRFTRVASRLKADGSLITEADTAVQSRLLEELTTNWPEIPVLGEEMDQARQRAIIEGEGVFWCLDPLDGTTNFAAGLPYFAVSLALIEAGQVVGGVVYDPQRGECFRAERGSGAWINGERLQVSKAPARLNECVALVDIKRLDAILVNQLAAESPFRSQRSFGAVALDWCWVAAGRCHIYLHGRQNIWDYAAGSLVLEEAGGVACLTERPGGECDEQLYLGSRVGVGAVSRGLFNAWRAFLA